MVESEWVNELTTNEDIEDDIYDILYMTLKLLGEPNTPSLEDKESFWKFCTEILNKHEEDIIDFLYSFEKKVDLTTPRKIELEKIVQSNPQIINPSTYEGVDGLCGVISFILKEVSEYLGIISLESAKKTTLKEKILGYNSEKITYFTELRDKLTEVANKHNIPTA
mmetsp:Transcript_24586/g.21766  ORF Transcript_24586/g.21766 Transcript_24586/m.21766 type:complete len:166 (-) Transcript_24586:36-533(-)